MLFRDVPMGAVFGFRRDGREHCGKKLSDQTCQVPDSASPWDMAPDEQAYYPVPKLFPMQWEGAIKEGWSFSAYGGDTPIHGLVWRWPSADEHQGMWYWLTPDESGFLPVDLPFAEALRHVERVVLGILTARLGDAKRAGKVPLSRALEEAVEELADPA
jgi:hypothetical protein